MRIYAFLAINGLLLLLAFSVLSFAVLRYRSGARATLGEVDRLRGKLVDYPETRFYQAANDALNAPDPKTVRVVFLGDSIVKRWDLAESTLPYEAINRGIGWQTTSEMLVRIRPDAIDLSPGGLVIVGGGNDFSPVCGPLSLRTTQNNIRSMVELARNHGIAVVIGTVLPICTKRMPADASVQVTLELREKLNDWLRSYCNGQLCTIADFDAAMKDRPACEYLVDASHPNNSGYCLMNKVVAAAIQQALATAQR